MGFEIKIASPIETVSLPIVGGSLFTVLLSKKNLVGLTQYRLHEAEPELTPSAEHSR